MTFHFEFKRKATEAAHLQSQILGHRLSPFLDEESQPGRLLTCCSRCGMRVEIANGDRTLCGEALTQKCDGDAARAVESRAWLTGQVPVLLLQRLQAEVDALEPDLRARFDPGDFDVENFRLCSADGALAICWQQRDDPDWPAGEDNPQEPGGMAWLEHLVPTQAMRRARYTGPRLNPNGHENQEHWLVFPLEKGELGLAYEDSTGRWRFRREEGVVGYYVERGHIAFEKVRALTSCGPRSLPAPSPPAEGGVIWEGIVVAST